MPRSLSSKRAETRSASGEGARDGLIRMQVRRPRRTTAVAAALLVSAASVGVGGALGVGLANESASPLLGGVIGAPLAVAIRLARSQAPASELRPPPPEIRRKLEPHFGSEMLARVRWTTAEHHPGLGTLSWWLGREGAVTLDDVIVFADESGARSAGLWAHELTHVEQYSALGIDGFAHRYAGDWRGLEWEAEANRRRIVRALKKDGERHAPSRLIRTRLSGTSEQRVEPATHSAYASPGAW